MIVSDQEDGNYIRAKGIFWVPGIQATRSKTNVGAPFAQIPFLVLSAFPAVCFH